MIANNLNVISGCPFLLNGRMQSDPCDILVVTSLRFLSVKPGGETIKFNRVQVKEVWQFLLFRRLVFSLFAAYLISEKCIRYLDLAKGFNEQKVGLWVKDFTILYIKKAMVFTMTLALD